MKYLTVFESGITEPGLDNYNCPLRDILTTFENDLGINAAALTRYELNPNTQTYTVYTFKGLILSEGSNLNVLPVGNYAKYIHTLFTADVIREGDRVEDVQGCIYEVLNCKMYSHLNRFSHYVCELMEVHPVTHYSLNYPWMTYIKSTIYLNFSAQGLSTPFTATNVLTRSKYTAATSATVQEGDLIVDEADNTYIVSGVSHYPTRNSIFNYNALSLTLTENAVLRTLTLEDQDATTGHYKPRYFMHSVKVVVAPKGQTLINTSLGPYTKYDYQAVLVDAIYEGDILNFYGVDFEVKHVVPYHTFRGDGFRFNVCVLVKRDFELQPSLSGSWHVDSLSIKTDPRNRIKTIIDTYFIAANVTTDNGATAAVTATCFDGAIYPLTRVFLIKGVDVMAVISRGPTSTLYTDRLSGHKPYAFEEQVKIEIFAVNKPTVTASNLAEKYEQEIRRIFTTYDAYTTVRDLDTIEPTTIDLGYTQMCKTGVLIRYKRPNDDYTNSGVTITYGASQANTFTIPNIIKSNLPFANNDNFQRMPTRLGQYPFMLGSDSMDLYITVDLSVGNWLRPQNSTSKTDVFPHQVFLDIMGSAGTQAYHTLDVGWMTFSVRLVKIDPVSDGNSHIVTLTFKEYNATPANATYTIRWGI